MHRAHALYANSSKDQNALVTKCAPLIDRIARQIAAKTGLDSLFDDLWSAGALGLLDAASRFDPSQGVRFESFVEHRIRGAMIDELRRLDHLPRRLRAQTDKVEKAKQKLGQEYGRAPTHEELASHLDVGFEELDSVEALSHPILPLDEALLSHSGDLSAEEKVAREQLSRRLAAAISDLPERLRTVMGLHYEEGLNYREIAQVLSVSEPRVCQLHSEAVGLLRKALEEDD